MRCCCALLFSSMLVAQAHDRLTPMVLVLEADGKAIPVAHCSGGGAVADVATQAGHRMNGRHYEPLVVEVDPLLVVPWIADFVSGKGKPLTFDLVRGSMGKVNGRTQVLNAILTQVDFMALGGEDKRAVTCTLTFQPERAQDGGKTGDALPGEPRSKQAVTNSFRLTVGGEVVQAARIGAINVRLPPATASLGVERNRKPGTVEAANLVFAVPEQRAEKLLAWHKSAVVEGKTDVRTITVELMSPDQKTSLLKLEGKGVGMVAARRQFSAASEQVQEVAFEVWVDEWSISQ